TRWTYVDRDGKSRQFVIGSYSLGISRIAAALVEQNHDDLGIIWPAEIAPFHAYLVGLNLEDEEVRNKAEALYQELQRRGVDVLYDDREVRAGEKFDDADLLGIPVRLTISKRTIREGKIEFKLRKGDEKELTTYEDVLGRLKSLYADINRG
ncbi:MAG TPA: proline--tRNA ligase, partial [Desulfobacteraceae bacterium]|nr:proline--tRNA ligase [Desulfobacteraceae bacterium]